MVRLSATAAGQGPPLVLLHGVGLGPPSFDRVAELLARDHHVVVIVRPGDRHHGVPIDDQADAVAETMTALDVPGARVVGVSGGATLALALAIRHPHVVGSTIAHEPLLGRHAPGLHVQFQEAATLATSSAAGALEVIRGVLGDVTWEALSPEERAAVEAEAPRARHEVPLFAAFDPDLEDLAGLRPHPLLVTVGSRSGTSRIEVASRLQEVAGADTAVVAGSGNAAQLDAPHALSDLVRSWRPVQLGCRS